MPRALAFFLTIVAAFPIPLAAAPPTFVDAPTTARIMELGVRLGVDPVRDRATFMPEMARLLFPTGASKPTRLTDLWSAPDVSVPVPLDADVWGRAVFRTVVPPDQLVAWILSDRRAAMLCRGFAALDDETLSYLAEHPSVITMLYERGATLFGAFGNSVRIHGGRVAPPGGDPAIPLWEAAARAPITAPEQFLRTVFAEPDGRLAYLYDVVASAEPASAAFALGLWISGASERVERFLALLDACQGAYDEWQPRNHPFLRPLGDLAVLLVRVRLQPSGAPAEPSSRHFWARALGVSSGASSPIDVQNPGRECSPIDAAWIIAATGDLDTYARSERLDQFAFGQRVFADVSGSGDAEADVVRGFRDYRMLLLGLERIGIRDPATYAAALQRAEAVMSTSSARRFWALAQFQGAFALLGRMHRSRTVTTTEVHRLVASLAAVPVDEDGYQGGLARWLRTEVERVVPAGATWEQRAIAALAGRADGVAARIFWEGQTYRLDLALAERQRLEIVRRKQGGHTLDHAMAMERVGRALHDSSLTLEAVHEAARDLQALLDRAGPRLKHAPVYLTPPGVAIPPDAAEGVKSAIQDLAKITKASDVRRASRVGASLLELADIVLGHALVSLAYAADMGDPDGPALLAGNVALRHDFGLARRDGDARRIAWASPRQDFRPGVPWHIVGSIIGLDVAMATLNLRRLDLDRPFGAPALSSIERDGLAVTVTLMDALRLTDEDRDAIAEAVGRGRARVDALRAGAESLDRVADLLGLDGWRRRELAWALQDSGEAVADQFSLLDLLTLGGGAGRADVDAWGTPAIYTQGCPCSKLPSVRAWRAMEGRAQVPMMAATMSDLNLAVALMLRDLNLPAALARSVLSVGVADFIDELSSAQRPDWRRLSRQAQRIRRQRVEDYVSAAAAVNGPLVPEEPGSSREP
jgi:hypothetical protein